MTLKVWKLKLYQVWNLNLHCVFFYILTQVMCDWNLEIWMMMMSF